MDSNDHFYAFDISIILHALRLILGKKIAGNLFTYLSEKKLIEIINVAINRKHIIIKP